MSGKIMGQVWDLDLPHNKLIVLLAMADHADHDGSRVYPSMGLIAWKTGYSERHVRRIVGQLVKDKLLSTDEKRPGQTTLYSIHVEAGKKKAPFVTPDIIVSDDPGQNVTPDMQSGDATPDKMSPHPGHPDVLPTPDTRVSYEPSLNQKIKDNDSTDSTDSLPLQEQDTVLGRCSCHWESNGGLITIRIKECLEEALSDYSEQWVIDAINIAVEAGKYNNWRYVEGILKNWKTDGRKAKAPEPAQPTRPEHKYIDFDEMYPEISDEEHAKLVKVLEEGKKMFEKGRANGKLRPTG